VTTRKAGRTLVVNAEMDRRIRKLAEMTDRSITDTVRSLVVAGLEKPEVNVYTESMVELLGRPWDCDISMLHDRGLLADVEGVRDALRITSSEAFRVLIARGLDA
jgi:hypothetical protein